MDTPTITGWAALVTAITQVVRLWLDERWRRQQFARLKPPESLKQEP